MTPSSTRIVDMTFAIETAGPDAPARSEDVILDQGGVRYTGVIYRFGHHSMVGTYIDLPGHIRETDDGQDAAGYPIERLFRVPARTVHLARASGSGGVSAAELAAACQGPSDAPCLVLNALGQTRFDGIANRSVWLEPDAVRWVIDSGTRLLVSDVYERMPLLGVFVDLFRAGVSTVCQPVDLHRVTGAEVRVTVLMPRYRGLTQIPCRAMAECG